MIRDEILKYYSGKKILVTGGSGLIGIPLVRMLKSAGAYVRVAALDEASPFDDDVQYIRGDLCEKDICDAVVKDMQIVFHLAGIKGGIGVAMSRAADFLIKNVLININLMEASRKAAVERFLYASSICIYPQAEVFREDDAWKGLPHPSDKFGAMAKLTGELAIESYKLQYGKDNFFIARPANTYGPHDNFNAVASLIIPSLIYRLFEGEDPLVVWGDGSAVRDFIFSEDVAEFLILMTAKENKGPFNVGSGRPLEIKEVVSLIAECAQGFLGRPARIRWDPAKPSGEKYRVTDISKAEKELGWKPQTGIREGIHQTIKWYHDNRSRLMKRYDILSER